MDEKRKEAYTYLFTSLFEYIRELAGAKYNFLGEAQEVLEDIWDLVYTFHNLPIYLGNTSTSFDEEWFWSYLNKRHITLAGHFRRAFETYLGNYTIEEFNLPSSWKKVKEHVRKSLIIELDRELSEAHIMYGSIVNVIAKKQDEDRVLFEVFKDNEIYYIETCLTGKGQPEEDGSLPICEVYNSYDAWRASVAMCIAQGQ